MSVIYSTDLVDIIDCLPVFSILPWYSLNSKDYKLDQPYFRTKAMTDKETRPKKKRKQISTTDQQTQERHEVLLPFLSLCMEDITSYWRQHRQQQQEEAKTLEKIDLVDYDKDNEELTMLHFPDWIPSATALRRFQSFDSIPTVTLTLELQEFELLDIFNQWIKNKTSMCRKITLSGHGTYLIPPQTDFLMGDLKDVNDLLLKVHRSSHYETQDIYDLYQIPISSMIHDGSLIAVWVTNKPKFRRFVIEKLFKSWKVDCIGEWTWIKVTNHGEPVLPLNSTHRKPYEQLIIGRYYKQQISSSSFPYQHSIVSVPSKRHSRKPPLQG
ncbi:MT-A70-domain-containing protein [Halteromyces radiatus]|uniref:MT-A70-domain-containing protein n=1 Tax=Halteromyces radiatus TaxID=101107 RepID=UPI00221F19BF|nr:MT-A70-domain-containing protein [Halteromyces radiatus]KAI8092651.1 MT-A70-domain-containing protein [Halteromyces radiatus]